MHSNKDSHIYKLCAFLVNHSFIALIKSTVRISLPLVSFLSIVYWVWNTTYIPARVSLNSLGKVVIFTRECPPEMYYIKTVMYNIGARFFLCVYYTSKQHTYSVYGWLISHGLEVLWTP